MGNGLRHDSSLAQAIIQLVKDKKPENVHQLVALIKATTSTPEQKIVEMIIRLQTEGRISLQEAATPIPRKLGTYLMTKEAHWYWTTMFLAATTTIAVFTIPEDAYPIVYARYILGTLFVIGLPGYSFTKALFPAEPPFTTSSKSLDSLERLALSVGVSLALVPLAGLVLNYTPWGIRQTPIVLSLLTLTIGFATIAIIREHKSQLREKT